MARVFLIVLMILLGGCDLMDLDLGMEGTWGREIEPEIINSMTEFAPSISISGTRGSTMNGSFSMGADRIILNGSVHLNGTRLESMSGCMWDCSVGYYGGFEWGSVDSLQVDVTFSNQQTSSFVIPLRGEIPHIKSPPGWLVKGDSLHLRFHPLPNAPTVHLHHFYNGDSGSGGLTHQLSEEERRAGEVIIPAHKYQSSDFDPPLGSTIYVRLSSLSRSAIDVDGKRIQIRTTLTDAFQLAFLQAPN